jgi:hypothetical protein
VSNLWGSLHKLKEAFAVAVIVTRKAMCSTYVTYEWSWALGSGIPVVPLLFEDLPFSKTHARLSIIHRMDCLQGVGDDVIEELRSHQQISPVALYLNRLIMNEIMPFRILARIAFWLYPYATEQIISADFFKQLFEQSLDEASSLSVRKLPELIVNKSYALSSGQIRICNQLIVALDSFWEIFYKRLGHRPYYEMLLTKETLEKGGEHRLEELEPIIENFETETPSADDFKRLDFYLSAISENRLSPDGTIFYPPGNALLLFPSYNVIHLNLANSEQAHTIEEAIEAVRANHLKKE